MQLLSWDQTIGQGVVMFMIMKNAKIRKCIDFSNIQIRFLFILSLDSPCNALRVLRGIKQATNIHKLNSLQRLSV